MVASWRRYSCFLAENFSTFKLAGEGGVKSLDSSLGVVQLLYNYRVPETYYAHLDVLVVTAATIA